MISDTFCKELIMKRIVLAALVFGGLVGCATSTLPTGGNVEQVDDAKVAAIERAAARSGVKVIWLRMPTKTAPADGG